MDQAFVDGLVDQRHRRIQKLRAASLVTRRQSRTEALDLRAKLAPVAAIDLVSLRILTDAFDCRFMICH